MVQAYLEPETLRVVKVTGNHNCTKDPDLKYQIQMENEMKELAETTNDNFRDIYSSVCLKNPSIATRISYDKVRGAMKNRRKAALESVKEQPQVLEDREDISMEDLHSGERKSLVGSFATTMEGRNGKNSTYYVLGDYLYCNYIITARNLLLVRCIHYKIDLKCKGHAYLERESLQIVRFTGEHSCVKDPDLKYEIQMETEMKELAETTSESFRDIYNRVCLKNPTIAKRISFDKISGGMKGRRKKAMESVGEKQSHEQPTVQKKSVLKDKDVSLQEIDAKNGGIDDPLVGSIATPMEGWNGKTSTVYVIGDYLYGKGGPASNRLQVSCINYQQKHKCKGRALLEPQSLKILKFTVDHSCTKDPNLKYEIQMATEMIELAETTGESFMDIFNSVCLAKPAMAKRFMYEKVVVAMKHRRKAAIANLMHPLNA